jgi:pilus assembly protein CpaB
MKTRAFVMLGLALLLAGAAVFLARNWVQSQVQPVASIEDRQKLETTQVVVASTQLHFGNKVRREHLRVVEWPTAAVPEGSFKSVDGILGTEEVDPKTGKKKRIEDRVVLRTIEINEPVLKNKITGFGGRASLSTLIAPGMRATTIRVNDITGVAGFVLPGDRVDILLTRAPSGGGKTGLQTDVFLQNMKVLAIAQDANEDRSKPAVVKAVTLEVTPTQGQKLTLAQKLGSLSLSLRHINTVNAVAPVSIKARDLRVGEANLAPDPKGGKKGVTTVEIAPASPIEQPVTVQATTTQSSEKVVTKTVAKANRKNTSTVKIVRGLTAKEYEVQPEKATFSAPAYSKPLNLLPSALAPAGGAVVPLLPSLLSPSPLSPAAPTMGMPRMTAPSMIAPGATPPEAGDGQTALDGTALDGESGVLSNSEPISLLKSGGRGDDDG